MQLELIGPHPFDKDGSGGQTVRVGTLFPEYCTLYTQPPPVHAFQRSGFIALLNARRAEKGLPALGPEEEATVCAGSVDLFFEPDQVLIRPNPERMELAFAADELLQGLVSKRRIKFLRVTHPTVREEIKRRGECWRLSSIPRTQKEWEQLILNSKVGVHGSPIYFCNRLTGTRWLTFQEFEGLGKLDAAGLARHLQEIAELAAARNRQGRPEVDFFGADSLKFGARDFVGAPYAQLPPDELRRKFETLREHFRAAVDDAARKDDMPGKGWCKRMLSTLFLDGNEMEADQPLSGLGPEFQMQVKWLPGGRFEEGEFLFDPLLEGDECDPHVRGIILNILREYGDVDYINVGELPESLSVARPQKTGRRGVYITEFKPRSELEPVRRFIRLQKWDVREHLDEGMDLLQAIRESEEYTDYCLDRRLGCLQLGMNLMRRVVVRRLRESYQGKNDRYRGEPIRTTYFERECVPGIATDKLPVERYAKPGYALEFARLLGQAAACNIIVGRALDDGKLPVFDDGDELVREGEDGLPTGIVVADHSGAFGEYKLPLSTFAKHYARPINNRQAAVPNPPEFTAAYLDAFRERFLHMQGDYRKRRRAFDTLFKHCKYDVGGSFAYRWEQVLRRLDQAEADAVVEAIRKYIGVKDEG